MPPNVRTFGWVTVGLGLVRVVAVVTVLVILHFVGGV